MTATPELRADCSRCFALCCVAPSFARSADFGFDKAAGEPCRNLADDFRCSVHDRLRDLGLPGCTIYDCFGAGQQLSQVTFAGRDWRTHPRTAPQMFARSPAMRQCTRCSGTSPRRRPLAPSLAARPAAARTTRRWRLTALGARRPGGAGRRRATARGRRPAAPGQRAGPRRRPGTAGAPTWPGPGSAVRTCAARPAGRPARRRRPPRRRPVAGRPDRGRPAGADLGGADLSSALFLTQLQVNAARGDAATRIPESLARRAHWTAR